jgi:hypothetical protein
LCVEEDRVLARHDGVRDAYVSYALKIERHVSQPSACVEPKAIMPDCGESCVWSELRTGAARLAPR